MSAAQQLALAFEAPQDSPGTKPRQPDSTVVGPSPGERTECDEAREHRFFFGMPDRSGTAKYTHLIRSPWDPEEGIERGTRADGSRHDPTEYKSFGRVSIAEWSARVLALFAARPRPRTFNRICVELTGHCASTHLDTPLDRALWKLVKDEVLAWSNSEPPYFVPREGLER